MRYISPLKQAEGLGASHTGTVDHWRMTISAVALAVLTPAFLMVIGGAIGLSREAVLAYFGRPYPAIVTALFIVVGMLHFIKGMQIIIDDYLQHTERKVAIIFSVIFGYGVIAAAVFALAKMAFTS
ncbi:succinate dehydrogenase, hydrophobic membrane anchor protein [Paracoccus tegillarcae]|uniref:Succinate dehydrogenase hydrophobic membrane anchor subunit n=1 Tax=Paracoccus tegillarcae TaxID=1529068 RepID=A0A2K9F075_9RHOB|nr:succinate dehydrogenase, hydrophobic membrane anchor protein [Paracoccus tegillarcae]AUH34964.1 succinate dehydrogenase, hydrophobic membrane anchor protein [Paracoccus tegillarcae]